MYLYFQALIFELYCALDIIAPTLSLRKPLKGEMKVVWFFFGYFFISHTHRHQKIMGLIGQGLWSEIPK